MSGKLFIISSPSGAGKTSLVAQVIGKLKNQYSIDRVVTYTSRAIRSNEIAGDHYHFVSPQEFKEKLKDGFFLEWSGRYDNYYGTPREIIDELDQGTSKILIIDRLGAERVIAIANNSSSSILTNKVISIWIKPPSLKELERRLFGRGQDTKEQIKKRLNLAMQEIEKEKLFPLYQYSILNDDFSKAEKALQNLICSKLRR